jgi:protein involved in polysaccharide export with SLBB domain
LEEGFVVVVRRSLLAVVSLVLVAVGVSACASKQVNNNQVRRSSQSYEQLKKSIQESLTVAPGNILAIHYEGDSKISGNYKVDFDGRMQMPYKVTVKAAGLTTSELRDEIQRAYRPFVKGSSSVEIEIKDRSVYIEVRGEVKAPGRYLVRIDMPLEELVALAGGFVAEAGGSTGATKRADYLGVDRPTFDADSNAGHTTTWFHLAEYFFEYDTEPDFLWHGGEKLFFQATAPADANIKNNWQSITVMGEVRDPKDIPVLPNADLLTYISRAGGTSSSADLSQVEIIHRGGESRETVNLVSQGMTNQLRAGDVIVIRAVDTRPSIFDRIASYALTLATVTLSVAALIVL